MNEESRKPGNQGGSSGEKNSAPLFLYTSKPLPILDGVRILVVDDEADTRDFLVAAIEMCGGEVIAVS